MVSARTMLGKRGKMCFSELDDRSGKIEITLFSEVFEKCGHLLVKDAVVIVEGKVSHDNYSGGLKMLVDNIRSLQEAREHLASDIRIKIDGEAVEKGFEKKLKSLLLEHGAPGSGFISENGCQVAIEYRNPSAHTKLVLSDAWRVSPNDDLIEGLRELFGYQAVQLHYPE